MAVTLNARARSTFGKNAARKLRRGGYVPAVIYGHGDETRPLEVAINELERLLSSNATNTLIDLRVEGGKATSALYDDGLANFFLDDMFEYQALLLIPNSEDQERLAATLAGPAPERLHSPAYNMLAYPYSTQFQNSNQWVLETYAASLGGMRVRDRTRAQAWLKLEGFRPITVDIPAVVRLGARVARANVTFEDQPFERRMAGKIDTVTVDSVVRFVRERDQLSRELTVRAQ